MIHLKVSLLLYRYVSNVEVKWVDWETVVSLNLFMIVLTQQTQHIGITFVQRRSSVFDVDPKLYKSYRNGFVFARKRSKLNIIPLMPQWYEIGLITLCHFSLSTGCHPSVIFFSGMLSWLQIKYLGSFVVLMWQFSLRHLFSPFLSHSTNWGTLSTCKAISWHILWTHVKHHLCLLTCLLVKADMTWN